MAGVVVDPYVVGVAAHDRRAVAARAGAVVGPLQAGPSGSAWPLGGVAPAPFVVGAGEASPGSAGGAARGRAGRPGDGRAAAPSQPGGLGGRDVTGRRRGKGLRFELLRLCACGWRVPAGASPWAHADSVHDGQDLTELVAWCGRCDKEMDHVGQVGERPAAVQHHYRCGGCGKSWRPVELADALEGDR